MCLLLFLHEQLVSNFRTAPPSFFHLLASVKITKMLYLQALVYKSTLFSLCEKAQLFISEGLEHFEFSE